MKMRFCTHAVDKLDQPMFFFFLFFFNLLFKPVLALALPAPSLIVLLVNNIRFEIIYLVYFVYIKRLFLLEKLCIILFCFVAFRISKNILSDWGKIRLYGQFAVGQFAVKKTEPNLT